MKRIVVLGLLISLAAVGCSKSSPTAPKPSRYGVTPAPRASVAPATGRANPGRPDYEPAFVNGQTVTINAILAPSVAPGQAQSDFFLVVYPIGFQTLGIGTPQCNPCDHFGDGIDFTDFHDHVLDSMPGSPGHGEFTPLWHVYAVVPAYNGQADHDAQINTAYAAHIPTKSEAAVEDLLAARLRDGSPAAVKVDKNFYFICSVVNANAAR